MLRHFLGIHVYRGQPPGGSGASRAPRKPGTLLSRTSAHGVRHFGVGARRSRPGNGTPAFRTQSHALERVPEEGDRICAIAKALEGLPKTFTDQDIADRPLAYEALYWAVRSRSVRLPVSGNVHASLSWQGDRVATVSSEVGTTSRKEGLKLWDARSGALIGELLPTERSTGDAASRAPAAARTHRGAELA